MHKWYFIHPVTISGEKYCPDIDAMQCSWWPQGPAYIMLSDQSKKKKKNYPLCWCICCFFRFIQMSDTASDAQSLENIMRLHCCTSSSRTSDRFSFLHSSVLLTHCYTCSSFSHFLPSSWPCFPVSPYVFLCFHSPILSNFILSSLGLGINGTGIRRTGSNIAQHLT